MIRLIKANFTRMFRSRYFQFIAIIYAALNIIIPYFHYKEMQDYPDYYNPTEEFLERVGEQDEVMAEILTYTSYEVTMFNSILLLIFLVPILIGFFIGVDYSDGTIRNKLVVGHKRRDIYLANLITGISTAEILYLGGIAIAYISGRIMFTHSELGASELFMLILAGMFITASLAAVSVFIAMYITSLASGLVISLLLSAFTFGTSESIVYSLQEPEYIGGYVYENTVTEETYELFDDISRFDEAYLYEEYGIHEEDIKNLKLISGEKNPFYVGGLKRKIYTAVKHVAPACRYNYINEWNSEENDTSILWSSVVIAVSTALGMLFFRKKDLK